MAVIVLCNGPYKTGSTKLYTLSRKALDSSVERDPELEYSKNSNNEIKLTQKNIEYLKNRPGYYVLKSHCYSRNILNDLLQRDVKIVTTRRNYTDICLSHRFHFRSEKIRIPALLYLITVLPIKLLELTTYIGIEDEYSIPAFKYETLEQDVPARYNDIGINIDEKKWYETINWNCNLTNEEKIEVSGMKGRDWFHDRQDEPFSKLELIYLNGLISLLQTRWMKKMGEIVFSFRIAKYQRTYFDG